MHDDAERPGAIEMPLPRDPLAPREARTALRVLVGPADGEQLVADAELVVSELVTNVLTHTVDGGMLRAWRTPLGLHIEVVDTEVLRPRLVPARTGLLGGHGMHVVDRLASSWGVVDEPPGKCVWAELPWRTPPT
jgi:anti-sigma regulatory factor (Ser/Thr protein kinase)